MIDFNVKFKIKWNVPDRYCTNNTRLAVYVYVRHKLCTGARGMHSPICVFKLIFSDILTYLHFLDVVLLFFHKRLL